MKRVALVLALITFASVPLAALARPGAGGGGGRPQPSGGGGARPQQSAGGGGFNMNRDTNASKRPTNTNNVNRNNVNTNNVNRNNVNTNNVNRNNVNTNNVNRNNVNTNNVNRNNVNVNNVNRNVNNVNVNRVVVVNPIYRGPAWGWNRGVVWVAAPGYWGGGFWGAMAIGATTAIIYGTIVANSQTYTSYQVQPSSPGATLLSNYQLTQTPCGPPNLVVVYGPNNSLICAYPNNLVSAGTYTVDSSNLSLVSQ